MELIDRQALKKHLMRWQNDLELTYGKNDEYVLCIGKVLDIMDDAPTIDSVPVRHGEWKEWDDGDNTWSCSVCGNPFVLIDGTPSDNEMKYCPNCGARMDGGKQK